MHSTSDSNTNNTLETALENNHYLGVNMSSSPEDVTGIYGCFPPPQYYIIFCQGGSEKITETPPKMINMPELSSTEDSNTDTTVYVLEDNSNPNVNTQSFSESVIGINIFATTLS